MKGITLNSIIIQLLLLSSSVYGANDADIYLTFKPSTAATVNFEQQDRFVWQADSDTHYYSPLALPYLHREQKNSGHLCFDLIMKSKAFERVIKEKLGNIKNTARLEMVPISGISISLYKRGNLYPDPLSESFNFPTNVSYQKPIQENICLPLGQADMKDLDNIEVRTNIRVRYLNQSETSCSVIASMDKSLYQNRYADSKGSERLVDETQIQDAVKEKLFTLSYQCRTEKGEEYTRPGGISNADKNTLLTKILSQLETEFVTWTNLNEKVNQELINKIPVEDISYVKENSNKTVTVEELSSNIGTYLANRILEHNKLPPLVSGAAKDKKLNTKETTQEDKLKETRKVTIPGGLNFISLRKNFDSQRIKYSYSDIVEIGLLDSQLDPLHGPFKRNSERKYTDTPFDSNFPNKVIMAYYGDLTKLPDNWALCDGSEVSNNSGGIMQVPNLVDRYLKGVSKTGEVVVPKGSLPITGKIRHTEKEWSKILDRNIPNREWDDYDVLISKQINDGPDTYYLRMNPSFANKYSSLEIINSRVELSRQSRIYSYSNIVQSNEPPFMTVYWICKIY
ncbi:hypothetical protein QNZ87_004311 [Vibrio parahaemolyticus]|nr:hypothetical protein [Vibrio parahaemolyticus]